MTTSNSLPAARTSISTGWCSHPGTTWRTSCGTISATFTRNVDSVFKKMSTTRSRIEWTERTWNPVVGCTKVSAGCKHCYAEVMARRLQAMGAPGYEQGFGTVRIRPEKLEEPLRRSRPTVYFVNSMSDLFHPQVPGW